MKKTFICKGEGKEIRGTPDVVQLLPMGYVKSQKGNFFVDDESLKLMKEHMASRGLDIVIDYEHQTLEGVQAPAGGWIKDLFQEGNAVCAKVEWTPSAKEYLTNKEYRYLSPVVRVRKKDNKVTELHSVALTNTPAIDHMFAIVNSLNVDDEDGGEEMDFKMIAKLLGLPEDATEEQVIAKIKEITGENETLKADSQKGGQSEVVANKVICDLLGVKEDAKTEEVSAAILSLKNHSEGVSQADFLALKQKLERRDAEDAVLTALKAGKISVAQKDWATEYALKDPTGFQKFVEIAPQAVPLGEITYTVANKAGMEKAVDETGLLVCKQLGVSKEDMDKFGKEQSEC